MYTLRESRRPKSGDLRCILARAFARCFAVFFGAGWGTKKERTRKPNKTHQKQREEKQRAKRQQQDRHTGQHQTPAAMVEKELEKYSQTAPKLVEMVPKRCRNALSGGLQEALEGSRRPLGLQVASGDAPGAFLGGSGRAPGAVLGGSRVVFRSLGGAKTASGAAFGRLFRTSCRNLCGRPVGGPKMHQKTLLCSLGRVSF